MGKTYNIKFHFESIHFEKLPNKIRCHFVVAAMGFAPMRRYDTFSWTESSQNALLLDYQKNRAFLKYSMDSHTKYDWYWASIAVHETFRHILIF